MNDNQMNFISVLKEELVPAQGCTEPIAIAYAAAYARELLGDYPIKIKVYVSGNVLKNAKSVSVPNAEGLTGIKACALLGMLGGDAMLGLRVLSRVTKQQVENVKGLVNTNLCSVQRLKTKKCLHILMEMKGLESSVSVELADCHDNIVKVIKDGEVILEKKEDETKYCGTLTNRDFMSFDSIYDFIETVPLELVSEILHEQISCNMAIALEGLKGNYGIGIGACTLEHYNDDVFTRIRAMTAAASEARMCGCTLPVVTNSGSGNQGISASVPVVVFAKESNIPFEKMCRALLLSNLLTIYQKTFIGRLSAFCGAISATCGAMCGIAYMLGAGREAVKNTVINTLASDIGVVCDGAKASCAIKIACGLDSARLAMYLALDGKRYPGNCGLVCEDVDSTVKKVGKMACNGMKSTDKEILRLMFETEKAKNPEGTKENKETEICEKTEGTKENKESEVTEENE